MQIDGEPLLGEEAAFGIWVPAQGCAGRVAGERGMCVLSGTDLVAPIHIVQAQGWQGWIRRVSGARRKSGSMSQS